MWISARYKFGEVTITRPRSATEIGWALAGFQISEVARASIPCNAVSKRLVPHFSTWRPLAWRRARRWGYRAVYWYLSGAVAPHQPARQPPAKVGKKPSNHLVISVPLKNCPRFSLHFFSFYRLLSTRSALNNHSRIIRLSYFSTLHRPPREYKNSRPLLRKSQYLQLSYPRSSVLRFFHSKARFKAPFSTGVLHLGSIAESSPPHRRSRW